jgi:hypothetical protein
MYEDEDNDGKFPDESPVEVRYSRSKQEERADRGTWPWLPGSVVEQCGKRRSYRSAGSRRKASKRRLSGVTARK